MKYILMMTGAKTGVDAYRAWSEKDIRAHFAFLKGLNKDLSESGELVANEGLARRNRPRSCAPARMARRSRTVYSRRPRSFWLGYWIVDVESPERAYEIASRASAAPGPGGATVEHAD